MPEYMISGVPVNFPFEPYDVQTAYMEKVITCLRDGTNGVLESPTGTGKTLSLLCSSLAWLMTRKSEVKLQIQKSSQESKLGDEMGVHSLGKINNWGVPKIIYASRTHSQLSQAMQELKRTSYSFMRAVVLGSRDQLCIHPEVMREQGNANKVQMCKLRVDTRTCNFHSRVESKKEHPDFREPAIMDIEDLVAVGRKLKMCPYFGSKELVADADITFMPYNYLLDPKARKANKVELANTIVILDEAHNIEKICEESASVQIRSSDIAVAIDDITGIMKAFSSDAAQQDGGAGDERKDFTIDDLALLKEMLLDLEKAVDDIVVDNKVEGSTYPPSFMFDLLAKANLHPSNVNTVVSLLERLIQYLAVQSENGMFRKGRSFDVLLDLLTVVLANKEDNMQKVHRSFKVHVQLEEEKKQNSRDAPTKDGWFTKASATTSVNSLKKSAKIVNYWCFNPGFGMEQLLNKNVRSVILTSGTLAPLKPLIAELSIPVAQHLENPHIVSTSQVFVKIIGAGPDREPLISNYANRDNPKYVSSLGQTILNVSRIVPDGLLVFFPSYPLLNQCVNSWQASGLWSDISRHKPIYVEPRDKESFTTTMEEFYQSIRDSKGACFMAVCRGKVSEGLDFADRNGRAVIITGLPFPPLKDPKVVLKKRYLEDNRTKENELLTGQAWYSLEATRAVNQAIGRVIRHRSDYGAILLCDSRFQYPSQVQQLSKWIRGHLAATPKSTAFGPVVRELREFFKTAEKNLPKPKERAIEQLVSESCEEMGIVRSKHFSNPKEILQAKAKFPSALKNSGHVEKTNSIESWSPEDYASAMGGKGPSKLPSAMDFISRLETDVATIDFNNCSASSSASTTKTNSSGLVSIYKRERDSPTSGGVEKKKRYKLVDNNTMSSSTSSTSSNKSGLFDVFKGKGHVMGSVKQEKEAPEDRVDFLRELRSVLSEANFGSFTKALIAYKNNDTIDDLIKLLLDILGQPHLHYMLKGMRRFLKVEHKEKFDKQIACVL